MKKFIGWFIIGSFVGSMLFSLFYFYGLKALLLFLVAFILGTVLFVGIGLAKGDL